MGIKLICAVDANWAIGNKSSLLFHIPADLKRFKNLTEHQFCVMGRNTYESILTYNNGNPLSNRTNVVLTRNRKFEVPVRVYKSDSVEHILNHYHSGNQDKDIMIIGGRSIYDNFLPHADEVLITYIDAKAPQADTYFNREMLEKDFEIAESAKNYCEKTGLDFYYVTYKRKLN